MAANKKKLEEFLSELPLLNDEKRMWYRLGFYVAAEPCWTDSVGTKWCKLTDGALNERQVTQGMAKNLRITILEWWEAEKKQPRETEGKAPVVTTPFDELEIQRG